MTIYGFLKKTKGIYASPCHSQMEVNITDLPSYTLSKCRHTQKKKKSRSLYAGLFYSRCGDLVTPNLDICILKID